MQNGYLMYAIHTWTANWALVNFENLEVFIFLFLYLNSKSIFYWKPFFLTAERSMKIICHFLYSLLFWQKMLSASGKEWYFDENRFILMFWITNTLSNIQSRYICTISIIEKSHLSIFLYDNTTKACKTLTYH